MSILDELPSRDLNIFPGTAQRLDETHIASNKGNPGALLSLNCEYESGSVITRRGFGAAFNPNRVIKAMYNWRPGIANRLIYLHDAGATDTLIAYNIINQTELYTLLSGISGADSCIFADGGTKLYFAFHTTSGIGATQGYVWDGSDTNAIANMEKLFQRPLLTTEATITSAAVALLPGEVALTAGVHNIAVIISTKNGYETGLTPVDTGMALVPYSLTASGTQAYTITCTPTGNWPNWCYQARVVMTTVKNTERYYIVPDGAPYSTAPSTIPPPNASTPTVTRIAISDTELASGANSRSVDDLRNLYQQDATGSGPFNPVWVAAGTNRMAYGADIADLSLNYESKIYISEPNNYQHISADQHGFSLPGGKRCTAGVWMGKTIYMFGPSWTYSRTDNGRVPVEWAPVETIDERIGTKFPRGISANSSRGWIWVGDETGLYIFRGGSYETYPISYTQGADDWARINFGADAGSFKVIEDVENKNVIVVAALDSNTFSSHLLVWDYTEGITPGKVKYSLWNIIDSNGSPYLIGGICSAQSVAAISTSRNELWIGRASTAGKVLRQKYEPEDSVTTLYSDDGAAINSQYQTPPMSWAKDEVENFYGAFFRVRGEGDLTIEAHGADATVQSPMPPISLTTSPGRTWFRYIPRILSNSVSFLITNNNAINSWFVLSGIKVHYKKLTKMLMG